MEFDGHKLKTKVYVFLCRHDHHVLRFSKQYSWGNAAFENFLRRIAGLGAEVKTFRTPEEVHHELETKDFYGYSTLMFIFYFNCRCDSVYAVNEIHKSLQINELLRNITKIVLDYSFSLGWAMNYNKKIVDLDLPHVDDDQKKGILTFKWINEIIRASQLIHGKIQWLEFKGFSTMEGKTYHLPKTNNMVFIICKQTSFYNHCFALARPRFYPDSNGYYGDDDDDLDHVEFNDWIHGKYYEQNTEHALDCRYDKVWKSKNVPKGGNNFFAAITKRLSEFANKKSIQEILQVVENDMQTLGNYEMVVFETTSTEGCYFFSINPALFIAINHLTFQNFDIRVGAEKDLEAIKKACRQQRIPYLIFEDATAEEAQKLLQFLQTTDLSILKHLFVCIMSHGDEGDIIYTKTSSYTADDVKRALWKNPSLKQVKKLLFLNFCRGSFHPEYALIDEPQPLELTDASDLDDTTVVLYSTRKGCVSLREKEGSPCVQKFTVELEKCFTTLSVMQMREKMENYLLKTYVDFESMTELVSKHGADHIFNMEFQNTSDFMELFKNIEFAASSSLLVNRAKKKGREGQKKNSRAKKLGKYNS